MDAVPAQILVVDDSLVSLRMVESILTGEGFEVTTALNAKTALDLAFHRSFDLILLDVILPDISGFEVCRALKNHTATTEIPILFLSALDDVASKVEGFHVGGVDYVSKPLHAAEVLARVRVHLRMRAANLAWAKQQQEQLAQWRDSQRAILPRREDVPGACFAAAYQALDGAGGDFYEVLELEAGVYAFFVADVSGHGVSAAFLTAALKALLRQCSGPMFTLEETMRAINRVLRGILGPEQYITATLALIRQRSGKLTIINAGHPSPIVIRGRGGLAQAEVLTLPSEPLGMHASVVLQQHETRLEAEDRLYLYTDGLIEGIEGSLRRKGLVKLQALLRDAQEAPLSEAVAGTARRLRPNGGEADDLLLLGIEMPGRKEGVFA